MSDEQSYSYFTGRNRNGVFVQGVRRESPAALAERLFRNRYEDVAIWRAGAGRNVPTGDVVGRVERTLDDKRVWWGENE